MQALLSDFFYSNKWNHEKDLLVILFELIFYGFFLSVEPMWPVVEGTELREDIKVLIKFWQSILSDKKYMKNFMNALDPFQLGQQSSVGPGSQCSSSQTGLGPYVQVSKNNHLLMLCWV